MTLQIEQRSGLLDLEVSQALFRSYPHIRGPIKGIGSDGYPEIQRVEHALATLIDKDIRAYLRHIYATYGGGVTNSGALEDRVFLCLRARKVDQGEQRLQPDAWYLYSLNEVNEALVTIEENWRLLLSRFNGLAVAFADTDTPTLGNFRIRFFSPEEISTKMES